ncbi:beta strand repeat-containing protein, partial [Roseiconus nitratireducens]|uniref:beta strand repeat-containing protein n=1 Tax=Roseiconus nitratireducens TaxID=2605748 RepID=UPI00191C2D0F
FSTINNVPALDLDADDSSGAVGSDFTANFVEGGGAVLIADGDAVLADVDSANLASLTVTISNLLDGSAETLTADTTGTLITANYSGGVLTLSGSDTIANYEQVLRTVRYDNASANPDSTDRIVEFVANDGFADSNTATATISITTSNDAPTLDLDADNSSGAVGSDFTANFVEGGGAVLIADGDAALADVDSANLASLTVTITNLLDGTAEVLTADTTGTAITASYSGGVLTLSGSDTIANYQQVLRTVRYDNASASPDSTDRLVEFVANDGLLDSSTAIATVSISANNDAPTLDLDSDDSSGASGFDFTANFVEGGGSVLIADSDAALADVDSANLASLTVTITNLLDGAAESLTAATTGTAITASYSSGVLTLSGSDTVANYQLVLRTVRYDNASANPDATARLVEFVANDGLLDSNTAIATVSITTSNDAPNLDLDADDSSGAAGSDFTANFVEGGGAVLIADGDAVLADVDSANLASLTVTITNLLDGAAESLTVDTTGTSITASFSSGVLTLSGSDTIANYQQVLRTVRYDNASANPDSTDRLVEFVANDGLLDSSTAIATVSISASNDAPTLDLDSDDSSGASGFDFTANFLEGGGAILIADGDAVLVDVDSANLTSLAVTISNPLDGAAEVLTADTTGTGITASYSSGVLTLSGSDTVSNYEQVLGTVRYDNASSNPDLSDRLIEFLANDGVADSNTATATISITTSNDAPTLDLDADDSSGASGFDFTANFVEGGGSVLIADSDAALADVDSANLGSLTVTITNLLDGAAETLTADTTGTAITASYSGAVLTLSGSDTVANYRQVLRTVRYDNASPNPDSTSRTIEFVANDGFIDSSTATSTVAITSSNDPPTIDLDADDSGGATGADYSASFVEGGGAVLIVDGTDAVLSDSDDTQLMSLTVTVTNLRDGASESLSADTAGTAISASYSGGTLTLSGVDSVANYQQVLRTVRYDNLDANPNTSTRRIEFVANDGIKDSQVAVARVTLSATNNAPIIRTSGSIRGLEDTATSIDGIRIQDPDVGLGTLAVRFAVGVGTLTVDTSVAGGIGALNVLGNGTSVVIVVATPLQLNETLNASDGLTYLGPSNFYGADTLLISATDLVATTNESVSIEIEGVNDPPVAVADFFSTVGSDPLQITVSDLVQNDIDVDGDVLSITAVSDPSAGTLSVAADGSLVFEASETFSGLVTFSYAVDDGSGSGTHATVQIDVAPGPRITDIDSPTFDDQDPDPNPPSEEPATENPPVTDSDPVSPQPQNAFTSAGNDSVRLARLLASDTDPFDGVEIEQLGSGSYSYDAGVQFDLASPGIGSAFTSRLNSQLLESPVDRNIYQPVDSNVLWEEFTQLREQMGQAVVSPFLFAGSVAGLSGALSLGYVLWTVRSGLLLTSLLAQMPAWRMVDPLLVLSYLDELDENGEDDSLENLVEDNDKDEQDDAADDSTPARSEPS